MRQRPLIIPAFIPHHGCPHRCIFCDQTTISQTPENSIVSTELISQAFEAYQSRGRDPERPTELAFFGGNFLGLPPQKIVEILTAALQWIDQGYADAIRFSTRPDTIDDPRLNLIAPFPVKTVEVGAQSMDDQALKMAQRGHTAEETIQAIERLKQSGYQAGLQLMVGLPGESEQTTETTGKIVCWLSPDFVRIYPTLVLAGSPLAEAFRSGKYKPLTLEKAVEKSAYLAARFLNKGLSVIRMGLPADVAVDPKQLLAGPYHPAFGHLVYERLYLEAAIRMIEKSRGGVVLHVHPKGLSTMRGLNNGNITKLTRYFHLDKVKILPDPALNRYQIAMGEQCRSILDAA